MSSKIFYDHFNRIKILPLCLGLWHITQKTNSKSYKVNIFSIIYSLCISVIFCWNFWMSASKINQLKAHDMVVKYMIGYISLSSSILIVIQVLGLTRLAPNLVKIFSKFDIKILERSDEKILQKNFNRRVFASFALLIILFTSHYFLYKYGISAKTTLLVFLFWYLSPAYNYVILILFAEYLSVISRLLMNANKRVIHLIEICKSSQKGFLSVRNLHI